MPLDGAILGEGIYTPREAARLLHGTHQEVLRWTRGSGPNEPLWNNHYRFLSDTTEISFLDLVELRVVRLLRAQKISLQAIRFAIRIASEKFNIDRPLSSVRFKTDGTEVLMDAVEKDGEFVSLSKRSPGQKVFAKIVEQSVVDLDYEGGQVVRWWPTNGKNIVIDPKRSFGAPIVNEYGISTSVLSDEYDRCKDFKYLSRLFEIGVPLVREAVSFEKSLNVSTDGKVGQSTF